jgi:hypothetical protein
MGEVRRFLTVGIKLLGKKKHPQNYSRTIPKLFQKYSGGAFYQT